VLSAKGQVEEAGVEVDEDLMYQDGLQRRADIPVRHSMTNYHAAADNYPSIIFSVLH